MKALAALPLFLLPAFACAQTAPSPQIMEDVHQGDFADAQALAAQANDPLVQKLVTFFRLTDPGGGTADEINTFIAQNPDWPEQGLLALRAAHAAGAPSQGEAETPDFLTQVEALHAAGQDQQAAQMWASQGKTAIDDASADQQMLFWNDQNRLARALLAANDAKDAYAVVAAVTPPANGDAGREQTTDRDFLAGFLALRFLNQPQQASIWFSALASASPAVITQARAYYWLARTESGAAATADYQRAASYPTTYYGQLAALALGESPQDLGARIRAVPEPNFTPSDAVTFAVMELPRAAVLLQQMGDNHDAGIFLNRLGQVALDDSTREMTARLALGMGLPQTAVAIARTAGINGQMLPREGWPMPFTPPSGGPLEPAVADAIMRQESSFDPTVVSGAGAIGLMQLMPATARKTGQTFGLAHGNLFAPDQNMALGEAYLAQEVQNFGNCLPLAIAAYNGGPTNVANWISQNGDPELGAQAGSTDIIDWIEEIPFNETRNYVQRVVENVVIYRALLTGSADSPLAQWMPK
jgi:soluble lytic murein transglycosylase